MSKHFERDLERLQQQLLALFGDVEQMIDQAARALCERDLKLVEVVIANDPAVDEAEVAIEEDCLKILALHQPVAADLRRISSIMKINLDLERMADLACNIAERARDMHEYANFPVPGKLAEMARQSAHMVRRAIDAFVNSDTRLAKHVIQCDEAIDADNRQIIFELQTMMRADSNLVEPALHCFSASRHIERLADHAENIAEDVVYFVDGEIVRHKHGHFTLPSDRTGNHVNTD
ncbi:MAG: phosphate signaling complex protein PhoU [Planctomycetales bacterium]|nr:phosphate signaling complex protein PhoU [Planctomycetales bacterium]